MTVGLLICDHVREVHAHIQGKYPEMFRALLPELQLKDYFVCDGEFPKSATECDAWIATGSKFSVYDKIYWIEELKTFVQKVQESGKRYVGVCFGHQMLGEALGGKVEKAKVGWNIGIHNFKINEIQPWMQPQHDELQLQMMCQDQVVRLPDNSTVLAQTDFCSVGMFQVGNTMLGIQGHPEFSKNYEEELMKHQRGLDLIGDELFDQGVASLSKNLDNPIVRDWIVNFIHQRD